MNVNIFSRLGDFPVYLWGKTAKGNSDTQSPTAEVIEAGEALCMESMGGKTKTSWLTVGVKLMIGVGLVSNLCLGLLLYTGWRTSQDVGEKTNALLALNRGLNADLRERVSKLQEKYLQIPTMLRVDPAQLIREKIKENYTIINQQILVGRSQYSSYFKRKQRRDISKGKFVVLNKGGQLIVFQGLMEGTTGFTNRVSMTQLSSSDPDKDALDLSNLISAEMKAADSQEALAQKIAWLKSRLADEGLAAEKSRTQILYHVDQIKAFETALERFRENRQNQAMIIAGITIALNLLVLYAMTWINVEQPLKRLTRTIERINAGESVSIPFQNRKDKIGILAGVLQSFKGALQDLRNQDVQKGKEQQVIQELIHTMADLIEDLQTKSQAMKTASFDLYEIAGSTSDQSDTADTSISRARENISGVSHAAGSLKNAVQDIHAQVACQNDLVADITTATSQSMENIQDLNSASADIEEIIKIVKNIAGQIKLLALNARIEASRAGAAGKGFAVVANEVRDLSIQTESANQEIENKIFAIQGACTQMTRSTQGVEGLIQKLSDTGSRIYASVKEQQDLSESIAKKTIHTSEEAGDLSNRLATVKEAAQNTRRLSETVRTHSTEMDTALAELLRDTQEKLGQISTRKILANDSLTIC